MDLNRIIKMIGSVKPYCFHIGNFLFFLLLMHNGPVFSQPGENMPELHVPDANKRADVMYFDATRARLKGDDREAEDLLLQVVKLKPDAAGAYYDLARINMKGNKPDKATQYIQKAISLEDTNPWYKSQYAEILVSRNKFDEAADIYGKLAAEQKHNQDYLMKSSMLYTHTGKYKEAMAALDKLLERDKDDEEMLLQKQQLYLKMNDLEGAITVSKRLIELNPTEGRYYARLADVYENNGQHEKAAETYKDAEQRFPNDPFVQLGMATYYKNNKNIEKYHEYVKKAIANKNLDAEQQITFLIEYMRELGSDTVRIREALSVAKNIADQHKDDASVLALYADVLTLNGKSEEAVEQYKKAVALDPSRYQIWQNLLYNYTGRNDADSMLLYSERALKYFPNQAMLHYFRGIGFYNKKDYNSAITSINRAVDMQPEDNEKVLSQMYSTLGEIYNTTKQYKLSDSVYQKALKIDPDNAAVLNNYSYYLSLRNTRLEEAEKMSKHSLELRPDEATYLDTYGWILFKLGKYEKAREYIQKAVDSNPSNADGTLFEHLGDVYYKLNNGDKAIEYWMKAKEKGTENQELIDKKIRDRKIYE
jgi:tetratricopeptide (TPR) repeat protein